MAKIDTKPFSFTGFDADKVVAVQQRNVDAIASASQIVVDGAKAIAQRQSEIMQSSVDRFIAAGQDAFNVNPNDLKPADQVAKAKGAYEEAVSNMKELAEIAMKAQSEAAAVLTRCMMANMDDLKTVTKVA